MDIKIKKIKNKKKYLNESYGIFKHYKQLLKNPNKKIKGYITEKIYITIAVIVYVSLMLIIFKNPLWFNCLIIGFTIMAIIVYLKDIIMASKIIKDSCKEESDSVLSMDSKMISLINNKEKVTYYLNIEDLKLILITENCISFLPKESTKGHIIIIPIDYEEECYKLLEKYNKKNLIFNQKKK